MEEKLENTALYNTLCLLLCC